MTLVPSPNARYDEANARMSLQPCWVVHHARFRGVDIDVVDAEDVADVDDDIYRVEEGGGGRMQTSRKRLPSRNGIMDNVVTETDNPIPVAMAN